MQKMSPEELRELQLKELEILEDVEKICSKNDIKYWLDFGTLLGAVRHKGFIPWDDDIDISMLRKDYDKFQKIVTKEFSNKYFIQTINSDKGIVCQSIRVNRRDSIMLLNPKEKVHQGVFMDVFPIDYYSNNKKEKKIQYKIKRKVTFLTKFYYMQFWKRPAENTMETMVEKISKLLFRFKIINVQILRKLVIKKKEKFPITNNENSHLNYGIEVVDLDFKMNNFDIFPLKKIEFEDKLYSIPSNTEKYLQDRYGDYMQLPKIEERVQKHVYKWKLSLTDKEYKQLNENYI